MSRCLHVLIIALTGGCFSPDYQEGIRCSKAGSCPGAMSCSPVDNRCYREAPAPTCTDAVQVSNPVVDAPGALPTGYRAISIPYTSNGWSLGLQRSYTTASSLLDGTISPLGNWYYAVGTTYCWGSVSTGCQPAPSGGAHVVELLVR